MRETATVVEPASTWSDETATRSDSSGTRAAEVYEQLRREIVEGRIRPRERLIEAELAERLAVSRTPIRESIQRLAADGLVISHRRGWVVREHSAQEIREIYEVRAALEGFAARLAAERATDEMLQEIRGIHDTYVKALSDASRGHLVQHNDDFHDAVVRASGNARLADQIRRNTQYYFIHRIGGFLSDDEVRTSIAGHQELVDALLARDPNRAEFVARTRVLEGLDKTLARLR
jgi:DNA-binding GntR family transcriptional regulator